MFKLKFYKTNVEKYKYFVWAPYLHIDLSFIKSENWMMLLLDLRRSFILNCIRPTTTGILITIFRKTGLDGFLLHPTLKGNAKAPCLSYKKLIFFFTICQKELFAWPGVSVETRFAPNSITQLLMTSDHLFYLASFDFISLMVQVT